MQGPPFPTVTTPSALPAHRLFTLRSLPIRYLVIPKCGCTFVKNLIWSLEKREPHVTPLRVHDDDLAFIRASDLGLSPDDISKESYAFTVLRRPIERFFSFYADKIIGQGRKHFHPVSDILEKKRGLRVTPFSFADHLYNCQLLIEWLEENIASGVDLQPDSHWLPQSTHFHLVKEFNLHLLTTSELDVQLVHFLQPIVPDIAERIKLLERNASKSNLKATDFFDNELKKNINRVYRKDQKVYRSTSIHWREFRSGLLENIPRALGII
jgi:hypothetical protein